MFFLLRLQFGGILWLEEVLVLLLLLLRPDAFLAERGGRVVMFRDDLDDFLVFTQLLHQTHLYIHHPCGDLAQVLLYVAD